MSILNLLPEEWEKTQNRIARIIYKNTTKKQLQMQYYCTQQYVLYLDGSIVCRCATIIMILINNVANVMCNKHEECDNKPMIIVFYFRLEERIIMAEFWSCFTAFKLAGITIVIMRLAFDCVLEVVI